MLSHPRASTSETASLKSLHLNRAPTARRIHGSRQNLANLANSLTTTSGVVAALNSILAGALAGDLLDGETAACDWTDGLFVRATQALVIDDAREEPVMQPFRFDSRRGRQISCLAVCA